MGEAIYPIVLEVSEEKLMEELQKHPALLRWLSLSSAPTPGTAVPEELKPCPQNLAETSPWLSIIATTHIIAITHTANSYTATNSSRKTLASSPPLSFHLQLIDFLFSN